ncbi:MAG: Asp/Glu/hydantoin racemase [Dehalococcoidia bacterium]|nr:Asp/Glu/hydantoin racemase [Dehalococcoidia bacterium]
MSKTVFIIHTNQLAGGDLTRLFGEMAPDLTVRNIIDDSMLAEVLATGGVTPGVLRRWCEYAVLAEASGADLIFSQCSSVGEAADTARAFVRVPIVKIDERMAEVACQMGSRIAVIATAATTLGPTSRLLSRTAERLGKRITLVEELRTDAFARMMAGDKKGHNQLLIGTIRDLYSRVDVIVCAQGSMLALQADLGETPIPVLMSPPIGVAHAIEVLRGLR